MSARRGFAPILILIFVLAVSVLGGAIYLYNKPVVPHFRDGLILPSPSETPSCFIPEGCSPEPPGTANWKTYRNTKYGYSLKYPPELNYSGENPTDASTAVFINGPNDHTYNIDFPESKFIGIYINTFETKGQTLDDYLNEKYPENKYGIPSFKKGLGDKKITRIDIEKEQGYLAANGMEFENVVKTAWIKKGDTVFEFIANHNGETGSSYTPEAGKIFDQILSTFQFLN